MRVKTISLENPTNNAPKVFRANVGGNTTGEHAFTYMLLDGADKIVHSHRDYLKQTVNWCKSE